MITVARVIEQIVDWTHTEIVALEAHLGVHPNRAPSPAPDPNAPKAEVPADPQVQAVVNGLETKLSAAEKANEDLAAKLKDATDHLTMLEEKAGEDSSLISGLQAERDGASKRIGELTEQLTAAQEQIAKLTAGQQSAQQGATDGKTQTQAPAADQGSGTGTSA